MGAAVAGELPGAVVAGAVVGVAAEPHAVRITSMSDTTNMNKLRFDWYISFSSGKVVWETLQI